MRKTLCLILCLAFFLTCGPKENKVEKIVEDGVEVVINHLEPYKIEGIQATLALEREMTIDTENDETAETGLVDIEAFDVDEEGNLYFIRWTSNENFVYKFDNRGRFVKSFVLFTDEEDRIFVMTYEKGASSNEWIFDIFTPEGVFFGRVPIKSRIDSREIAIRAKRSRIYSICEKESGYKELVVYKMRWE